MEEGAVKTTVKFKLKGKGHGNWNRSVGPRTNENRLWHFVKVC